MIVRQNSPYRRPFDPACGERTSHWNENDRKSDPRHVHLGTGWLGKSLTDPRVHASARRSVLLPESTQFSESRFSELTRRFAPWPASRHATASRVPPGLTGSGIVGMEARLSPHRRPLADVGRGARSGAKPPASLCALRRATETRKVETCEACWGYAAGAARLPSGPRDPAPSRRGRSALPSVFAPAAPGAHDGGRSLAACHRQETRTVRRVAVE